MGAGFSLDGRQKNLEPLGGPIEVRKLSEPSNGATCAISCSGKVFRRSATKTLQKVHTSH
jgi:hypothetical protein